MPRIIDEVVFQCPGIHSVRMSEEATPLSVAARIQKPNFLLPGQRKNDHFVAIVMFIAGSGTSDRQIDRFFAVVETGQVIPDDASYIGTVAFGGATVHAFEVQNPELPESEENAE